MYIQRKSGGNPMLLYLHVDRRINSNRFISNPRVLKWGFFEWSVCCAPFTSSLHYRAGIITSICIPAFEVSIEIYPIQSNPIHHSVLGTPARTDHRSPEARCWPVVRSLYNCSPWQRFRTNEPLGCCVNGTKKAVWYAPKEMKSIHQLRNEDMSLRLPQMYGWLAQS